MEPQARGLLETQSFHETDEDVVTDVDFTNMISEEEKEELKIELAKLEDEISTLRQVLAAKEKHLVEIKQKLGISLMNELKQNFSKSWHDMQTTSAYKKTHETLSHAGQKATAAISNVGTAISKKFGDMSYSIRHSISMPAMRPRLVGQATQEAVLKKFSAPQPMPVLRAPLLAPDSLKVKKSFSVKQQALLSFTCLSSETCPDSDFSALSHHTICATRFCQLWKIAVLALCWRNVSSPYFYFRWAILSVGTLYIIKTTRKSLAIMH
ncbi:tumor protein D53 isoform X2 [Parus major]|uniref:tumor protein D53 isoform X2 n=1 Tax=Parus major TaxID=9157 RepID=UPI00108A0812|nr:tumor protein D53 isoform X2 [Parus major]